MAITDCISPVLRTCSPVALALSPYWRPGRAQLGASETAPTALRSQFGSASWSLQ